MFYRQETGQNDRVEGQQPRKVQLSVKRRRTLPKMSWKRKPYHCSTVLSLDLRIYFRVLALHFYVSKETLLIKKDKISLLQQFFVTVFPISFFQFRKKNDDYISISSQRDDPFQNSLTWKLVVAGCSLYPGHPRVQGGGCSRGASQGRRSITPTELPSRSLSTRVLYIFFSPLLHPVITFPPHLQETGMQDMRTWDCSD